MRSYCAQRQGVELLAQAQAAHSFTRRRMVRSEQPALAIRS